MLNQLKNPSLLRALRSPSFALLWGGQTCSRLGDYLYEIGLAWWVLETTGSATAMAAVLAFAFGPMVLLGLIGGVAVDRYSRLHIMLLADIIRGGTALLVALLAFTGRLELWHVYGLSLVFGLAEAFFHPAYSATVPDLVPEEDLSSANSLTSLSIQLGRIAGPGLGALIIGLMGTEAIFLINGTTFGIAAVLLIPLVKRKEVGAASLHKPTPDADFLASLKEGVRYVWAVPWLWRSIIIFTLTNIMLGGPYRVSLPMLVDEMGSGINVLGFLTGLFAAGYILGGLVLGSKAQIRNRGMMIFGGVAMAGFMLFLYGFPIGIVGLAVAALLNGAALEVSGLAWMNSMQELIPREKLGRVISIDTLGSMALMPLGYGVAGWATDLYGPMLIFAIGGGLTACIGLMAYCHPTIRQLN
ncbi:MAG: MFS transporter [Chloroflexota bacterium]